MVISHVSWGRFFLPLQRACTASGLFLLSPRALAQDLDGLRLSALANLNAANADPSWIYLIAAGLVLFLVWNMASWLRAELAASMGGAPEARNLYLKLRYAPVAPETQPRAVDEKAMPVAHLLAMTLDKAEFVASQGFAKNELLDLDLASLPGFPARQARLRAVVVSQRLTRGAVDVFLVKVRFLDIEQNGREPLRRYLCELARQDKYAPA